MIENHRKNANSKRGFYAGITVLVLIGWITGIGGLLYVRGYQLLAARAAISDADAERAVQTFIKQRYGESSFYAPPLNCIAPCAENTDPPPDIAARAAVVIDAASGVLLFEKNPDMSIPPASLTKLVAIYTALQAIEQGEIDLTDYFQPPRESWAENTPSGSSLMFLGKNQQVNVQELILGMSVVSGNDAAVALAIRTAGSVSAFVARMNKVAADLGLQHTYFEEPSGLSEHNRTTARDFARFAAVYIKKYPQNLTRFHAVSHLTYPQPHNMLKPQPPIRQQATNTLLSAIDGCDGLKTGFIYESGFNIALTAKRNGIRFIAVILGGEGKTSDQGKKIREKNGKILLDWAFTHFSTLFAEKYIPELPVIPVLGGALSPQQAALNPIIAAPAGDKKAFTVALPQTEDKTSSTQAIRSHVVLPTALYAPVEAGVKIGRLLITGWQNNKEIILAEFPLIADRTIAQGSSFRLKYDSAALRFYLFLHGQTAGRHHSGVSGTVIRKG